MDVIQGDCRAVLRGMEPESVLCVVTSPPLLTYDISPNKVINKHPS